METSAKNNTNVSKAFTQMTEAFEDVKNKKALTKNDMKIKAGFKRIVISTVEDQNSKVPKSKQKKK